MRPADDIFEIECDNCLDDLEVSDVKKFSASLLKTLDSQKSYIDAVTSTNQFTQDAETALKEAIASTKTGFTTI